ncbi:hypothetical protein T05_16138 [Trichinella murrelli]|uniref:Uncharacterized protein n=1 Tax=Trichinella murrelli TaxID=144512 RepID=A0A0V0UDE8_9BILA|nr:hypothetical protein T05_16138 [Trichinella murrelli]
MSVMLILLYIFNHKGIILMKINCKILAALFIRLVPTIRISDQITDIDKSAQLFSYDTSKDDKQFLLNIFQFLQKYYSKIYANVKYANYQFKFDCLSSLMVQHRTECISKIVYIIAV